MMARRSWLSQSESSGSGRSGHSPSGSDCSNAITSYRSYDRSDEQMFPRSFGSCRPTVTRFAAVVAAVSVAAPLSSAAIGFGPPPGAILSREKLSRIDEFITGEIASGEIPGAIVLIQRHGQQIYFKCFGKRDVEKGTPMTANAIFPIHSVTKTITSVAAMMLVD